MRPKVLAVVFGYIDGDDSFTFEAIDIYSSRKIKFNPPIRSDELEQLDFDEVYEEQKGERKNNKISLL